jgi:hypothetical protein
LTRGSLAFVVVVSACAASSSQRTTRGERTKADPWSVPQYEDAAGRRCAPDGRRCPTGIEVPTCPSAPVAARVSSIDRGLLAKVGQQITVVAKPSAFGIVCTLEACDCCNRCLGPLLLCNEDTSCSTSIAIGVCDGDQSLTCCDIAFQDRKLVASGVLRLVPADVTLDVDGAAAFELEQARFCYLNDAND